MTHTVSFPDLGLDFEISRGIEIGSFTIYWYAVMISLGFLFGMFFMFRHAKKFGIDADRTTDVIFFMMILGIIGARAYYVIFNWSFYMSNPSEILNLRGGGLGFYGAIIGGLLGLVIGCKVRKMPMIPFMDLAAGGLFIGQGFGRWGNFLNGECFGTNTNLPWGMTGSNITQYILTHTEEEMGAHMDPFLPVHPTFFYESLWCFLGLFVLIKLIDKRMFDGQIIMFYLGWNGFGRFFIEGIRTDSLMIGSFRVSQILAGLMFFAAVLFTKYFIAKKKKSDDPLYMILWSETETGKLMGESKWDYKNCCEKQSSAIDSNIEDETVLKENLPDTTINEEK